MGFSDTLKMRVKDKANFTCCWCTDRNNKVEVHHIIPEAEGGPDTEDNAATLLVDNLPPKEGCTTVCRFFALPSFGAG